MDRQKLTIVLYRLRVQYWKLKHVVEGIDKRLDNLEYHIERLEERGEEERVRLYREEAEWLRRLSGQLQQAMLGLERVALRLETALIADASIGLGDAARWLRELALRLEQTLPTVGIKLAILADKLEELVEQARRGAEKED